MKRFLSLFLFTILFGGYAIAYDFSAVCESGQTLYYTITSSTSPYTVELVTQNTSTPYYTTNPTGDIVIPSSVTYNSKNYSVTSIGANVFGYCIEITSVTIPGSVKSIGNYAFSCVSLTRVNYTGTIAQWCEISYSSAIGHPLYYANDLYINNELVTDIVIPNTITEINKLVFYGAACLTSVTIPNSVTSIGPGAFSGCSGLTTVTIGEGVTSIGTSAFNGCRGLTSVTIPNSVTEIGENAFKDCISLAGELVIPELVTTIGNSAFKNCSALTTVKFNATNCTRINTSTWEGCSSFETLIIGENVISIPNRAFYGCSWLTEVVIPNSVTSIGYNSFQDCIRMTMVVIGNSVESIDNKAFYGCNNITDIYVNTNTPPTIVTSAGAQTFNYYNANLWVPCDKAELYIAADGWNNFSNIQEHFPYTIDAASADPQQGSASITQQPNCNDGTAIITATPAEHYHFVQWNDGNTSNPRTITVSGNATYTASFAIDQHTITVNSSNSSMGMVSGGGIYNYGAEVQISAIPVGSNHFVQWNDGNTDNPRTITVTADATYTAEFAIVQHTITALSANGTMGSVSGGGTYTEGTTATLTANANAGYRFSAWNDNNTDNPRMITVTGDAIFIATFETLPQHTIAVLANNDTYGTVDGGGTFTEGTEIQISAVSNENYIFIQWNDGNTDNPRSITVTENATYTAQFDVQHTIRYNATAEATGNWVMNNTNTSRNTWDSNTGDGVLYLNSEVTTIGGSSLTNSSPFNNNTNLVSVDLDNSGLRSIGRFAFNNCSSLTSITIGKNITSVDAYSFDNCNGLSAVYYTGDIADWCEISFSNPANPLYYAHNLYINNNLVTDLVIPNTITEIKRYAFQGATCLTTITIPSSVTSIGSSAFDGCSGLTRVNYTGSIAQWCGISFVSYYSNPLVYAHNIYINNELLTTLVIPKIVTEIKDYAFSSASCLTSVTIPNSVTSIGRSAFYNCSRLSPITIGNSVASIGEGAFAGCYIYDIYANPTTPPSASAEIFTDYGYNATLWVPCGSAEAYRTADIWSNFSNINERGTYNLDVSSANPQQGSASVTQQPNCSDGTALITATPIENFRFVHWNDGNTDNPRTIMVTQDTAFVAVFEEHPQYTITVHSANTSQGSVAGNGTFAEGTEVSISATASEHHHFVSWSDGNTENPRAITVTEDVMYIATFAIDQFAIMVSANDYVMGTVSGTGTYNYGTERQISAAPSAHYHFVSWNDGNTDNPRTIIVTQNAAYTARFAIDQHTITVASSNTSMGTASGGGTYDYGASRQISASPSAHYHFVQWSDGNTTNPRTINVTADATYTAEFAIDQYTITVNSNNSSMGTVSGGGTYNYGASRQISATANDHYHFVQWSDGNTTNPRTINVTADATYTAEFAIDQFTITVSSADESKGTVSGGGTYDYGMIRQISATANAGYRFVAWNDGNADNPRNIAISDNATYVASFEEAITYYTITLISANTSQGSVAGNGTYAEGTEVSISATAYEHNHFVSWNDGNTDNPRIITVTEDAMYIATFAIDQFTIAVSANDYVMGTVSGTGTYNYGTERQISAAPSAHYHFVSWNDGNTDNPRTITVTQNVAYTARFAIDQHTITVASSNTSMGTASGGGTYDYGASRQISASPSAHYHFVQWNDGNTTNPRTINVTADATYTAEFAIDEFTVTVSANNNYMGTVAGGGTYDYGTELQISAVPATCNRFVQWNDGNTESPRTITVVGNTSYTAVFETYQLTVSLSAEQIACNGGTANIINAVEGGTVPYNYAWSNGETSQNLTGVGTGTYSVTITDSNGCEATASTTITEPEPLTVSVLSNDPLCLGNSTMITSSVAGGTTPYSYAWSNGESSAIISIASGGAYSLTVTDANACTAVASMDVVGYVTASISMSSDEISDGIYYYNACAGGSIEMNGIIQSGTVNSWRWYINPHNGNSSVFTTQNITYTPTDALAHDITLTAMDEHGCPAVAHGRIRVAGGLAVPTLVSPAEGGICQGSERIITIGETEGSGIQVSGSYIEALPGYKVNNDTTFLPDGTGECYSTSIDLDMFADGATVTSIDDIDRIYINMEHSYLGDISMMIRCPNGQTCLLKAHSNSSTSAITMPSLNWTNSGGINNSESIGGGTIHLGLSPDPLDSTSFCYYTIGEGYSYNFTPTATLPFGSSGPETSTPYRDQCGNTETIRVLNEGDYATYESMSSLIGCPLNGTWTIYVCDHLTQDNGYIFEWGLFFREDLYTATWGYDVYAVSTLVESNSIGASDFSNANGAGLMIAPPTNLSGEQHVNINVVDNWGCITSTPIEVDFDVMEPFDATITGNTNVCNGAGTTLTAVTDGGVAPFVYNWNTAETTASISPINITETVNYNVSVIDASGCTGTAETSVLISNPTVSMSSVAVNCHNGNDGTATATITNGNSVAPYTYAWSDGTTATIDQTSYSITVPAGTYDVTVSDAGGCSATGSVVVSQPDEALSVSLSAGTINCNGETTNISTAVEGGTAPNAYSWSNGATSQNITDIGAGTYSITITDNNGCEATASTNITEPELLSVSLTAETIQYNGGTTDIYNMVTGGSSPYTFTWSNGEITQNLEGIGAGFYDVTVSDINGCSTTTSITITEPELFTIVVSSSNDAMGTVSGGGTYDEGSEITISATPAEHHHFIQWNDGNNDNPRTVMVTEDATYTAEFAIDQHTITVISANTTMGSVSGNGTYDYGTETSIIATANENYRFLSWNDNNTDNPRSVTITEDVMYIAMFENDNDPYPIYVNITDTACGSYTWNDTTYTQSGTYYQTFTASTYADSIVRLDLVIYSLPQPEITVDGILDACNPETASVILHTGEYNSYIWSNSATTESVTITTPGEYFVEVVDSHGCHGYSEMAAVGYSSTLTVAPQIKYVGLRYNGTNSYNIVQWMMDPADTVGVRGFEIYRENTEAGVYTLEQRITKPRQRSWTDPTADLTARAYRYKVCAIDECGGISPMSEPHKTMHLTINRGVGTKWNLIWSHYEGISFSTYEIYRGTSSSNMVKIAEMPSNLNSFTDNTNTLEEGMYYQIKTTGNSGAKNEEIELYSNIVANEFIENYTITALSNNVNYGAVAGSGTYPAYLDITLMAIPNDGYEFVSWNDGNTENPRIITVNEDATYIATFAESIPAATYTITAISANPAQGSVTGGGIYPEGAVVEIEAIANDGYVFASWTDGDTNNPRTITVTENAVYVAMFSEIPPVATYTITAISANPAQGTVTGGGIYPEGAVVEIEAIANDGYVFASWTDGDTNNPRTITVTENAVYVAMFTEIPPAATYTITAVSANPSQGTVTGGGTYPEGTEITIEAIAAEGYEFISWSDDNTENPRIITVTADAMFIASFAPATDIEESATTEINVFPNPVNDILNITSSETISEIEIINVMGQIVKRVEVNSDNVACDVENLISGMYVVRIYSQNGDTSQRKFIKK